MCVSNLLFSLIDAATNTGVTDRGLHGVDGQVVRDMVESCRNVAVHREDRNPPLIRLLHHSAQDEDTMGLAAKDMTVLRAIPGMESLVRKLL